MKPNKQARLVLLVISCISQGRKQSLGVRAQHPFEGQPVTWTWVSNSLALKFCVSASLSSCSSPSWERTETLSTLSGICDWVSASHNHWLLLAYTCKNCVFYNNTLTKHRSQMFFSLPYLLTFSVVTRITVGYCHPLPRVRSCFYLHGTHFHWHAK